MDNLRLDHPGAFSTHTQVGTHHLLNFSPSIEFSSQLNKPSINSHLHTQPLSSSWASLWADSQYPQSSPLLKNGMQGSQHGSLGHAWNVSVDPILQLKQGNTTNMAEFLPTDAPMDDLREENPTLQLKDSSNILAAAEFPHLVAPVDVLRGDDTRLSAPMNALRDDTHLSGPGNVFGNDNTHLSRVLVAAPFHMDKGSTSPVSVVSGLQPTKMDGIMGQILGLSGLSQHDRDDSDRKGRDGVEIVKAEVNGGTPVGMKGSNNREGNQHGFSREEKGVIVKKEEGGVTIASLEDGSIGLKLGKRTYYAGGEESGRKANSNNTCNSSGKNDSSSDNASGGNAATTIAAASSAAAAMTLTAVATTATTTTTTTANNNSVNKKHKGSSASPIVPACQAEGCTADLSGAKDYHRRHKVCEYHSKASKTKVNSLEQRFCQQCSRFHVLSAFDEGKRSCRRRLAGHNERRRKPPPEPMPFVSHGGFAYFADSRGNASLRDHPYVLQQHRRASMAATPVNNAALACHLGLAGFPQQETMGKYHHALELHHFMQGLPPGGGSSVSSVNGGGALMLANGNGLALSNTSSLTMPLSSSSPLVGLIPRVSSDMVISGRALSLLSSSFGSPETMSISLGMTSPSIDQFLSDTHAFAPSHQVSPNGTSYFMSGIGMTSAMPHNHALNSLTNSSSGCSTEIDHGEPPTMSNFEGRSLFMVHSENDFQNLQDGGSSHNGRCMLDLMQNPPGESHHRQQAEAELSFADLQGLSIFGRSSIM